MNGAIFPQHLAGVVQVILSQYAGTVCLMGTHYPTIFAYLISRFPDLTLSKNVIKISLLVNM